MTISKTDVERVALLARLAISEQEKDQLARQLSQILEHAGKIAELDTTDVKPTAHPIHVVNVLREDETGPELSREDVLANAPEREDDAFGIPKIV